SPSCGTTFYAFRQALWILAKALATRILPTGLNGGIVQWGPAHVDAAEHSCGTGTSLTEEIKSP
ncbi:MAG TPA: hypothetical protein PKY77_26045, partial [Phycisphaerae bacterium]|nr:hypothetical protein [Phycisphaerae bacterium]